MQALQLAHQQHMCLGTIPISCYLEQFMRSFPARKRRWTTPKEATSPSEHSQPRCLDDRRLNIHNLEIRSQCNHIKTASHKFVSKTASRCNGCMARPRARPEKGTSVQRHGIGKMSRQAACATLGCKAKCVKRRKSPRLPDTALSTSTTARNTNPQLRPYRRPVRRRLPAINKGTNSGSGLESRWTQ